MADITYTATNVTLVSGRTAPYTAGATITAGQPIYFNDATGRVLPTDADTQLEARCIGLALNGAAAGQTVTAALPGSVVSYGSGLVRGTPYYCSINTGAIANAFADLLSGDFVTILGAGLSAANMLFDPIVTDVAI